MGHDKLLGCAISQILGDWLCVEKELEPGVSVGSASYQLCARGRTSLGCNNNSEQLTLSEYVPSAGIRAEGFPSIPFDSHNRPVRSC